MRRVRIGRAAGAALLVTSIVVVVPTTAVFAAPVASVAVSPASSNPLLGAAITLEATFDNASVADAGFGPYLDVRLPIGGVDGDDGVLFTSASYLGTNIAPKAKVTCTGAAVVHPLTGLSVECPLGEQLIVLQLPFGSFTPTQPSATVQIVGAVSDLADIGVPLSWSTTPGFAYGNAAVGGTPIVGSAQTAAITPQVVQFTKRYLGPEGETATGPNYPRSFQLTTDLAAGQVITDLSVGDTMSPQHAFLAVTGVSPAGSVAAQTPPVGVPSLAPNNEVERTWAGPIIGTSSGGDAIVTVQFFVPDIDASGALVLSPITGNDVTTRNDGHVSGTVTPKDPRDPTTSFTLDPNTLAAPYPDDAQVVAKSIAVQKTVTIATDNGAPGATPGDVLRYTLRGQVSDYFTFAGITLDDVMGDGQTFLDGSSTMRVTEAGSSSTVDLSFDTSVDDSRRATCGDGTTHLLFDVSNAYANSGLPNGADGIFTGGEVAASTGPATFTITFLAEIDHAYTCSPAPNDPLDLNDVVTNGVTVSGEIYDNATQLPQATPQFESDTSSASTTVVDTALSKTVYARNGVVGGAVGTPPQYVANDTITYRLQLHLPISDIDTLDIADYLPLPVLTAQALSPTVGACTTPATGHWCYGPDDTFHALSGAPAPSATPNAVANSITFGYGTYDDPANRPTDIDILFTLTISTSPFRDGLILSNVAQATYLNSFGVTSTSPAIAQIELTAPVLRIRKGVVDTDSPNETFSGTRNPSGVTFAAIGAVCPAFSPTSLNSTKLNGAPNANVSKVDAADTVRFAIVVENTGNGLHGAFDVGVSDTMPAGFSIPSGGLHLCVTDGNGSALAHTATGFFTGTPSSGPTTGTISLTDGPTGALTADNAAHTSGTNLMVVSYELQLDPTVTFQAALTNTATITGFSGSEGGPNFTGLYPAAGLSDDAIATTRTPTVKKSLTATNQAHTTGSNVAIGEEATYTVTVTVPEGRGQDVHLVDTLPSGLALTGVDSITASAALTSSVGTMATVLANTQAALAAPGRPLNISFGTLTNSDTNNAVAETITVVYRAVVLNVAGNQSGSSVKNSVKLTYTGGASKTAAAPVTVVEPNLTVTKTVAPTSADAADTVTYSIVVQHSATSNADGFNVSMSDLVPTGVNYVPGSLVNTGGLAPTSFSDSGAPSLSATWSSFPIGSVSRFSYRATLPSNAVAPASITNTARLTWTSLPTGGDPVSPFNTDGRERTGVGGVDDYATSDTATLHISSPEISKALFSTSEASTTNADVTIGETVTYELTVTLPEGSIPAGFVVTDRLPNGLQYVAGSAQVISSGLAGTLPAPVITGGGTDGADVVFTFGATTVTANNNPADDSFVIRLTARVTDVPGNVGVLPSPTRLDNSAQVQLIGGNAVTSNVIRVNVVEPQMRIDKSVSPTSAVQGDTITITFDVENRGLSKAFDVIVEDVLDAHYDASTALEVTTPAGFTYARSGSTITYTGGDIPVGAKVTFVMTAALVNPLADGTAVENTATVTQATSLPGTVTGERAEPPVSSLAVLNSVAVDLTLDKDDGVLTVTPGASTTYNLTVSNVGGAPATGVTIDDQLPPGTTFTSVGGADCSDGGAIGNVRQVVIAGTIAPGATVTCTLTIQITNPAPAGTVAYQNLATVTDDGTHGTDPTPDNNTNSDTDLIAGRAPDIQVTKNDGIQTRAPGEAYTYTVTVSNIGNVGVTNVLVRDVLPPGLTFVACNSTSGSVLIACAESAGVVQITYADLAGGGGSAAFGIDVLVDLPAAAGLTQFVNNVSAADDGSNGADVNLANNADSDTDNLDAAPDMAIVKLAETSDASPGDAVNYALVAANIGDQDATGVVISDVAPAGLSIDCGSASPAATTCTASTITWGPGLADTGAVTGGIFSAFSIRLLTYTATIDDPLAAGTTSLTNTVTIDDDHTNGIDPTPENNSDTAVVNIANAAIDLSITKTDGVTTTSPGTTLTYTMDVVNSGNIGATAVVITDQLPAELSFVSCPALPVTCDTSALPVITWTIPTLAGRGGTAQVSFDALVNDPLPAGVDDILNVVEVHDDGTNGTDPTPEDNIASDRDLVVAAPDLDVAKNDGAQTRQPNEEFDYTLLVRNKGGQAATGITVVDTLPSELIFVDCPSTPVTCSASGDLTGGTVTWQIDSLAGGANRSPAEADSSVTLTVTVRVAPAIPASVTTLVNSVAVTDDGTNGPDPTPGDNTDADTDNILVTPDMAIEKTDGVDTTTPGSTLAYVLTVLNNGARTATGVTVTDTVPTGTTFVSCSGGCDSSALPTISWTNVQEDVTGTIGDPAGFDPGGIATFTVTVTVDNPTADGLDTIVNQATVADDGAGGPDPTPDDNITFDTDTLNAAPDLEVTKTDGVAVANGADTLDYMITVTNVGNQTAANVEVDDTLPADTTFVSCTASCDSTALPVVSWALGTVAPGQTVVVHVLVTVDDPVPAATDTYTNTVAVHDDGTNGPDPTPGNNTATDIDTHGVDLGVTKTDGVAVVTPGDTVDYTIVVTNYGPSTLDSFTLDDTLPAALRSVRFSAQRGVYDSATGEWSGVAPFATGDTLTLHVVGTVSPAATGTLVNTVTVTPPNGYPDRTPGNNTATDTDTLRPLAELLLNKELLTPLMNNGDTAVYRLTVTNQGPSVATGVTLRDDLPSTLVPVSASGAGWTCTITGQRIDCAHPAPLTAVTSAFVEVRAVVRAEFGSTIVNVAIVKSLTPDPHPGGGGRTDSAIGEVVPPLPATGSSPLTLIRLALECLFVGGVLAAARRRRRSGWT